VIERAVAAGVERILVPGWDLSSSEAALELAARHPGVVDAAVGIHPHDAAAMTEVGWERLRALAREPAVRAIGEIGLDYHRNLSDPPVQRDAFERQLALADELRLPVLVHDREAHADVTAALLGRPVTATPGGSRGVLHAFSGDAAMASVLTDAGYLVSFAFPVAFRSAIGPRAAAASLAPGTFVVETDAPYLGPDASGRNEPTTVLRVVAELARLRGEPVEALVPAIASAYRTLAG
jgi:TatD DNase family protein